MGYILNATVHVLKNGNEYVTSDYGMRTNPVSGTYSMHNGIDLVSRGSSSDDIAAYAAGVVSTVSYNEYRGYYVVIEHDGGFETLYQHLKKDSVTVKKGAPVSKGQKIAVMGSTGQSTGNHLHFEVPQKRRHSRSEAVSDRRGKFQRNRRLCRRDSNKKRRQRSAGYDFAGKSQFVGVHRGN